MAIDHIPYPETHGLARAEKAFYPVTIPVSHWQLRHYISAPEPDHLYYASSHHVFCLNTLTKKRRHIASLPFEARCTASGYGYVCVGGEDDGHFAAIKLSGALDVDSALPLASLGQSVARRAPTVKVERIGEEIVNSISIHRIQDEEAHLDDIVAVLTNNDRTVRIYSLPSGRETKCKDIPFAVNHSTISPDGQILVAVGYFTTAWNPSSSLVAVGSEGGYITIIDRHILEDDCWDEENRDEAVVAIVPGSRPDFPSPHPGAIRSMVFSPEPWDLLIWSEDQGRVCVGDLRTGLKSRQVINLEPKDETMQRFRMEIPEVAETPASSVALPTHLDELEADLLRRYRAAPDNASAVNFATEYIEARRRQREHRQALAAARQQITQANTRARLTAADATEGLDDPQGLTAREQQILETIRVTRQREEARSNGQISRSINYTTPDMFAYPGSGRSGRDTPSSESTPRPISEILSSVQEAMPALERIHATDPQSTSRAVEDEDSLPPLSSMRDAFAAWNSSGTDLPPLPQVTAPRTRAAAESSSSTRRRQQSRDEGTENNDENPWTTIEEHMGRGPLFESAARASATSPLPAAERETIRDAEREVRRERYEPLQSDLDTQRRIAASAARNRERWRASRLAGAGGERGQRSAAYPEGYEGLIRRSQMRYWGNPTGREIGVRTAGLAMSPDGSTLWAACEEGIFEINIKTKGRMFLPSLETR